MSNSKKLDLLPPTSLKRKLPFFCVKYENSSFRRLGSKTLHAFTLYELIIVMVLSSILIGVAFYAYRNLQRQLIVYDKYTTQSLQVLRLNTLLQLDANQSYQIEKVDNQWVFKHKDRSIFYTFDMNFITRHADLMEFSIDTFWVKEGGLLMQDMVSDSTLIYPIEYLEKQEVLVISSNK